MSQLTREQALDALPALAVGALSAAERADVIAAVERFPDLRSELARYGDATAILLAGLPERVPAPALKAKVLAAALAARPAQTTAAQTPEIAASVTPRATSTMTSAVGVVRPTAAKPTQAPKPGFWDWLLGGWQMPRLGFAALALVAGLAAWAGIGRLNALDAERASMQASINQMQADLRNQQAAAVAERDALAARLNQQQQLIARLQAPDAVSVAMASAGGANGRLTFAPQGREAVLVAGNMQPLAAGQAYQLWLFDATGKPLPSVTFTDASAGVLVAANQPLGSYVNYAISIEPRGGSASPTGPVVLIARG